MAAPITIDTTSTLDTILAFAGPLAGVGVGAWVTSLTTRRAARESERTQRRQDVERALARYMAAIELVTVELGSRPEASWFERQVDRLPRGRAFFFFNSLFARLVFGDRHERIRAEHQRARAEVVLLAPVEIIGLTMEVEEFFLEWQDHRGSDFGARWVELRDRVRLVAQRTVDEGLGRPYRAGETTVQG
jgi:hypothetical protein